MRNRIRGAVPATPPFAMTRIRFASASKLLCAECHVRLDRHQPDPGRPSRLLGTCSACGAWHLVDLREGTVSSLPDIWAAPKPR